MATVDFYWDIGSTNTYFAWRLLPGVLARTGAEVRCHPFNLGYVFRHFDYVLMEESRHKLRYRRTDLMRWADHLQVPFRMPDRFPIKTAPALRVALAMRRHGLEGATMEALFSAYWEQNRPVETLDELRPIIAELGLDADAVLHESEGDTVRQALIDSTQMALDHGVFGAPMFVVGEEMFWGKDRMDFLERELAQLD